MAKQELLGETTRENIYHCIKCGLCIAHCPVYKEVPMEAASPRGKVQLSRQLSEGNLELAEDVKEAFFSTCLLCGGCVANCPSGVHGITSSPACAGGPPSVTGWTGRSG